MSNPNSSSSESDFGWDGLGPSKYFGATILGIVMMKTIAMLFQRTLLQFRTLMGYRGE